MNLVGFGPYLSALHSMDYGRPPLALDLMEEWRPIIMDTLVLSIFNLKVLNINDFEERFIEKNGIQGEKNFQEDDYSDKKLSVILTDKGFRKFITQYERKMNQKIQYPLSGEQLTYRDCIREQVRHFARYLKGEEKEYQPMLLK